MHNISYNPINPAIFRIGDIVELQLSFIGWPTRNGKTMMQSVLRAITLLNGQFTQVIMFQFYSKKCADYNFRLRLSAACNRRSNCLLYPHQSSVRWDMRMMKDQRRSESILAWMKNRIEIISVY